ncbi:MAG: Ig-like domain-containing protein, partial [Bacteroidota bacterium]
MTDLNRDIVHSTAILFILFIFYGCAQQVPLTGGPRDELPPELDTAISTPNYQTNFSAREIELHFNEYIDLRDAAKQIVISPPLDRPPIIKNRLKRLRITLDEEERLKENATYVINFGKSIRDFTEGNEVNNFSYVFSTGDYIDSMSISGTVVDVKTLEPVKDVVIMLYIEDRDSLPYLERPFYFSTTDDRGAYTIRNLRPDTYKLVALEDQDLNYLHNPRTERIGYVDTLVRLEQDSLGGIDLEIWSEDIAPTYSSYDVIAQGHVRLTFEGMASDTLISILDSIDFLLELSSPSGNLMDLWYRPTTTGRISWSHDTQRGKDTSSARINLRTIDTLPGMITLTGWELSRDLGLHPEDDLRFRSSTPIRLIDTSRISIIDTTTQINLPVGFTKTALPSSKLTLSTDWPDDRSVLLQILPGGFVDIFGHTTDTLERYIQIASAEEYGSLELTFEEMDTTNTYIVELKAGDEIRRTTTITGDTTVLFERLRPTSYSLSLTKDTNSNGRWDPGNYLEKRQAERIYSIPLPV